MHLIPSVVLNLKAQNNTLGNFTKTIGNLALHPEMLFILYDQDGDPLSPIKNQSVLFLK